MHLKTRNEKKVTINTIANVEREFDPSTKIIGATSDISISYPTSYGVSNSVYMSLNRNPSSLWKKHIEKSENTAISP